MRTIEERGYVMKEGRTLFPTDTGEVVSDFLEQNFAEYISDTFYRRYGRPARRNFSWEREYLKNAQRFLWSFFERY